MAGLTTTPLREQLAGVRDERRPGSPAAFLAARRRFQAGERPEAVRARPILARLVRQRRGGTRP